MEHGKTFQIINYFASIREGVKKYGLLHVFCVGPPHPCLFNGTLPIHFFTQFCFFCNLILLMKRIVHLVPVKNIIFKFSCNRFKIDILWLLWPLRWLPSSYVAYSAILIVTSTTIYTTHSQMFQKVESDLPAKIWRLVGCTEMISW